jgi:hypothetical protein
MVTSFDRADVARYCRQFGPSVGPLPDGIDGAQLLWGIAGVESNFGENCAPRHEPAYDIGGHYAAALPMPIILQRYGRAAACSYGPLQVMFCNAPLTWNPESFNFLSLAMQCSVQFLNTLLRHWKPQSLDEIGECWNAGHITPDPAYTTKLESTYKTPMPLSVPGNQGTDS